MAAVAPLVFRLEESLPHAASNALAAKGTIKA
jgi:hypothetical protein